MQLFLHVLGLRALKRLVVLFEHFHLAMETAIGVLPLLELLFKLENGEAVLAVFFRHWWLGGQGFLKISELPLEPLILLKQ